MNWTFVIAYYNEAAYLGETLASLAAQTLKPFRLILVDNGSTDASATIARAAVLPDVEVLHLSEPRAGKIFALESAMPHLSTAFVAFGDADTFYPPDYLATAARNYAAPDIVAVMATDVPSDPAAAWRKRHHNRIASWLWPKQTHTGGFGQTFRTAPFLAAGGYAERHWSYVLMDHEIMQRVVKQGRVVYPFDLWCIPSDRRTDRTRVRWTLPERLLYHFTPWFAKDWYFYRFLGPRLNARKLGHLNLREKTWQQ
ncbi:glycosyltransferase involved in cell wall biosynthesis [Sphingomonas sp. BE138]|uniref:glycosyltransferase family 2 protein n=1 Tax=Sphingomonas sp. BE138 TaxID=2817845 RepID=UPI002855ADB6|nr:glycosyltransferase family 2 protein [Sphingomonas sp. BE138]MDR6787550.1 glycosyltransferase involved in cell wall biosynthesis [Sphingomonas sp. BE138]